MEEDGDDIDDVDNVNKSEFLLEIFLFKTMFNSK